MENPSKQLNSTILLTRVSILPQPRLAGTIPIATSCAGAIATGFAPFSSLRLADAIVVAAGSDLAIRGAGIVGFSRIAHEIIVTNRLAAVS